MNLKGYAEIKAGAAAHHMMGNMEDYTVQPVRVLDWARGGGALVVTPDGNAMADFPAEAIARSFRCGERGYILLPPDLSPLDEMIYIGRCSARTGGYDRTLRNMVVLASLAKGRFEDGFLWAMEKAERSTFGA
jgi:hypothetical protein